MDDLLDFGIVAWCRYIQFKYGQQSENRVFMAYGFWDEHLNKHYRQTNFENTCTQTSI